MRLWLYLLVTNCAVCSCSVAFSQDRQHVASPTGTTDVLGDTRAVLGGVEILLPPPQGDFAEVGALIRTKSFEPMVSTANRLLTAYVPGGLIPALNTGGAPVTLPTYAMVQVSKRSESVPCTPEDFQRVLATMEPALNKYATEKNEELEKELTARRKSPGLADPFELDRPFATLGWVVRNVDAAGYVMLITARGDQFSVTMVMGAGLVRVRERLIFVYSYRKYESPDSVRAAGKELGTWVDEILFKNR